ERHEVELLHLLGSSLDDTIAAVASVYNEKTREAVEVLLASGVVDVVAFATDDNGNAVIEDLAVSEVRPHVLPGRSLESCGVDRCSWIERHGYRVPQSYFCFLSCRYTNVSVLATPSTHRILSFSSSMSASSSSQTSSARISKEPALSTTYATS